MARKFKTGDRVKIAIDCEESSKSGYSYCNAYKKGNVGVVEGYDATDEFPYNVRMKKNFNTEIFKARELKRA